MQTHTLSQKGQVRAASTRGRTQIDWLDSRHSFSFSGYHDRHWMGFGNLRVINDDRVQAGQGFHPHSHKDMEIISYVVEGGLAHEDSMGNGSTIHAGEVQYMSAGSGVVHSEFNPSKSEDTRFLQIWVEPSERGLSPRYAQTKLEPRELAKGWQPVLSPDGDASAAIQIRQALHMYARTIGQDPARWQDSWQGKRIWLQVVSGELHIGEDSLAEGDAYYGELHDWPALTSASKAHIIVFVQPV